MIGDHPVKLGAVVVNQTYVIDDDVVDFPIFFGKVHSVADEQIFGASTGAVLRVYSLPWLLKHD